MRPVTTSPRRSGSAGALPFPTPPEAELQLQPMPRARSILWRPAGAESLDAGEPPVFVSQDALREVSRHIWAQPEAEVLGFLLGERHQTPSGDTRYLVVSATTRSSYVIPEEGDEQVPEDAWHAAYLESRRRGLELLGWYHSTPFLDTAPTPRDMRTHRSHFREGWQVGLLVAPRADRPSGAFFRAALPTEEDKEPRGGTFIPFYELVDEASITPEGRKRTITPWQNYVTDEALERSTVAAVVRPRVGSGHIPVLLPKGRQEHATGTRATPRTLRTQRTRTMSKRKMRQRRMRLLLATGGLIATAAAALGALWLMR
jgi:proteasome lid subunit RPN8/RPN11